MKIPVRKKTLVLLCSMPIAGAIMATQTGDTLTTDVDTPLSAEQVDQGLLMVSGLDDVRFQWRGDEARQRELGDSLCVHAAARSYDVTFLPQDEGFTLSDGHRRVPFKLSFNGVEPGPDHRVPLQVGSTHDDCDEGVNARVDIRLNAGTLKALPPGSYTSTVTMLIAPE